MRLVNYYPLKPDGEQLVNACSRSLGKANAEESVMLWCALHPDVRIHFYASVVQSRVCIIVLR